MKAKISSLILIVLSLVACGENSGNGTTAAQTFRSEGESQQRFISVYNSGTSPVMNAYGRFNIEIAFNELGYNMDIVFKTSATEERKFQMFFPAGAYFYIRPRDNEDTPYEWNIFWGWNT